MLNGIIAKSDILVSNFNKPARNKRLISSASFRISGERHPAKIKIEDFTCTSSQDSIEVTSLESK